MTYTPGVLDVEASEAGSKGELYGALSAQTTSAVAQSGSAQDPGITQEAHKAAPRADRGPLARQVRREPGATGQIDAGLLRKTLEFVDSIVPTDEINTPLFLAALGGTVLEMWESAATSSEYHQDILATLENAVRASTVSGSVTEQQLSAFREALTDLAQTRLVRKNAEVVRLEFIRQGFGPLAFVDEPEEIEHEESS